MLLLSLLRLIYTGCSGMIVQKLLLIKLARRLLWRTEYGDIETEREDINMNQDEETKNIIKKLFNMMENFALRLGDMENRKWRQIKLFDW